MIVDQTKFKFKAIYDGESVPWGGFTDSREGYIYGVGPHEGKISLFKIDVNGIVDVKPLPLADKAILIGWRNDNLLILGGDPRDPHSRYRILQGQNVIREFSISPPMGVFDAIYIPEKDVVLAAGSDHPWRDLRNYFVYDIGRDKLVKRVRGGSYAVMYNGLFLGKWVGMTTHGHIPNDWEIEIGTWEEYKWRAPSIIGRTTNLLAPVTYHTKCKTVLNGYVVCIEVGDGTRNPQWYGLLNGEFKERKVEKPSEYINSGICQGVLWNYKRNFVLTPIGDDSGYFNPPFGLLLLDLSTFEIIDLTKKLKDEVGVTRVVNQARPVHSSPMVLMDKTWYGVIVLDLGEGRAKLIHVTYSEPTPPPPPGKLEKGKLYVEIEIR